MKRDFVKLVAEGFYKEALCFYTQRFSASLRPQNFTFPSLLKACAKLQYSPQGQMLHTQIIKMGFLADVYSATALGDMYMKLHLIDEALKVFDEMPNRNLASMNSAVSGFSKNEYFREALRVVKTGSFEGFKPNSVTIASLMAACESVGQGMMMHSWAIKMGVEKDVYVATSILTMYMNCKELVLSEKVFGEMPNKNVVTYNAFLSGILQNGFPRLVLDVLKRMMIVLGDKPNSLTFVSVLSACASLSYIQFANQVHGLIMKVEQGLDVMVGTTLVDVYSKCGRWKLAYDVFKELSANRNLITWNAMISGMMLNSQSKIAVDLFEQLRSEGLEPDSAIWNSMISGFSQLGQRIEAFKYFKKMQSAGVAPSLKSITSILPVYSELSALQTGKEIHGQVIRTHAISDQVIATAIIDMYTKCGHSSSARRMFDCFGIKPVDPAFWNAMISGYGRNGEIESAFEIFNMMMEEKVQPNPATFVSILCACSHTGQVDKGWEVFRMMKSEFGLKPNPDHFGCMVDLLARASRLNEAKDLIEELPEPSVSAFASLLGACKYSLDWELGEEMAKKLLDLEPENPIPYVILSNIYAALERWEDVERIRGNINDKGYRKLPAFSSVGVT